MIKIKLRSLWEDKEHFQSSLATEKNGNLFNRFIPGTVVKATILDV
jgi:hypothetical protein